VDKFDVNDVIDTFDVEGVVETLKGTSVRALTVFVHWKYKPAAGTNIRANHIIANYGKYMYAFH